LIVLPLGVGAAVYLTEYAQNRKVISVIEFTNETLAGIPSIIYGLVGMLVFAQTLGFQTCLLSGSLTLVIMNLPTIIRTTQESLKTVPQGYREGALGLGAGKWHIIRTIVLPCSIDGIATGCILAVGRIVGESAALLFTAGAAEVIANGVLKAYTSNGATLSVLLYLRAFEDGDFDSAWAIGAGAAGAGACHQSGSPAGQNQSATRRRRRTYDDVPYRTVPYVRTYVRTDDVRTTTTYGTVRYGTYERNERNVTVTVT